MKSFHCPSIRPIGAACTLIFVFLSACGDAQVEVSASTRSLTTPMRWTPNDHPRLFNLPLQYRLSELPRTGEAATVPWTGNYWPTYQDNINYRWDGPTTQSPAAKYGEAFGVKGLENRISRYYGIESYRDATPCTTRKECDKSLGEKCAKRHGEDSGRCVPHWWGICHAWAPASILSAEPLEPVTHAGVTFKVQDIKALLTLAYNHVDALGVSGRCNDDNSAGRIEFDAHGRPTNQDCIDTNPGTLHLLLANLLGLEKRAFIEDRTFDDEVWNQPIRAFRTLQLKEVTPKEANTLLDVREGASIHEKSDLLAKSQWRHYGPYPVESGDAVSVIMSGSGDADLYVRFNEQPTHRGFDCAPYIQGSEEHCQLNAPEDATSVYISVNGFSSEESSYHTTFKLGGTVPSKYAFNRNAKTFFQVETEVDYIGESPANLDGNLSARIDTFTHTDVYHYILELDRRGRITGGEWIGESKRSHPDFLWLPVARQNTSIARGAIKFSDIQTLLRQSLNLPPLQPLHVNKRGTVSKNRWRHYGPFNVLSNELRATLSGGRGDADLYIRRGARPTLNHHDCRPYLQGNEETCEVNGPGEFHISVHGYERSTYTLNVAYPGVPQDTAITSPTIAD